MVNPAGTVSEKNDYYPFGLRHANASLPISAANRFKFNGKEEQVAGNLGLLDYGARMYDNTLGRWTAVDPLAEKYYPVSPYAYTLNNPVKYIDPDGRKIVLASNSSEAFRQRYAKTTQYMAQRGTNDGLAQLEASPTTYTIQEGEGGFNIRTNTIMWNPTDVVKTDNDVFLFPATILVHEIGHANQKENKSPEQFNKERQEDASNPYNNKLEEEVVKGVEQDAALKHGDIGPGETTRTSHTGGVSMSVSGLPEDKILENFDKEKIRLLLKDK